MIAAAPLGESPAVLGMTAKVRERLIEGQRKVSKKMRRRKLERQKPARRRGESSRIGLDLRADQ
ncbi:MAG TPA: hypothetical protein VGR64_03230, partial [Terracidiphilus sp.]|nr:hypothetical protein [Terracidiphilus sp.]